MGQGIELSVPGKTFLVGEYLALRGGPSILVTTEPRFVLRMFPKKNRAAETPTFHERSPAGKFIKDHAQFFAHWRMEFGDPYDGSGGFGASTAQFALLYMAELIMREGELSSEQMQWGELLRDYHLYSYSGEGEPPSGADLIAQLTGQVVLYDGQNLDVQSTEWPFSEIGFLLFHTGNKLATHEHLKQQLNIPFEGLRVVSQKATKAISSADADSFVSAVQVYGDGLKRARLLDPNSEAKIAWMRDTAKNAAGASPILAAKGCGAMGSDVLLVIYRKQSGFQNSLEWQIWLESTGNPQNLKLIASDASLSAGLKVQEIT